MMTDLVTSSSTTTTTTKQQHQQQQYSFNNDTEEEEDDYDDMYPIYDHSHHEAQHRYLDSQYKTTSIPTADVMHKRWIRQKKILDDSKDHLLSHPHDSMSDTGRNISFVLHDRERYGSKKCISLMQFQRYRHGNDTNLTNITTATGHTPSRRGELCHNSLGDRSPSTVLESPLQRRESSTSDMEITNDVIDPPILASNINSSSGDNNITLTQRQQQLSSRRKSAQLQHNNVTIDSANGEDDTTTKKKIRRVSYPQSIAKEIRTFGEYCAATKYHSAFLTHLGGEDPIDVEGNLAGSSRAVSTISVAFSPDGRTMASTHGDHTVKISCCNTGRLFQSLDGHPRTPWTVKYHPNDSRILASGCLGHQVRVWNWEKNACLQMIRLDSAIISLTFHPSGTVLAIANGSRLHFWGINDIEPPNNNNELTNDGNSQVTHHHHQQQPSTPGRLAGSDGATRSTRLTEMDQRHMLRCVHFPPDGKTIIIGGVNPNIDDSRRPLDGGNNNNNPGGSMTFYLRMFDFDIDKSMEISSPSSIMNPDILDGIGISTARRAISNPRTFVPRALLYNDGGFDLDSTGKMLCVCAELFLPDGVDNAMDLLHKEEVVDDVQYQDHDASTNPETLQPKLMEDSEHLEATTITERHPFSTTDLTESSDALNNNVATSGRSVSFREGIAQIISQQAGNVPPTPTNLSPEGRASQYPTEMLVPTSGFVPRTPPVNAEPRFRNLSPPPPPGSRFMGRGILRTRHVDGYSVQPPTGNNSNVAYGTRTFRANMNRSLASPPPNTRISIRPPHPLSIISSSTTTTTTTTAQPPSPNYESFGLKGRYVPHVVTISLDTSPIPDEIRDVSIARGKPPGAIARGYRPRLGQLLEACPLDASKASAVTCVKFSPSGDFCLIGYGVRETVVVGGGGRYHPVTAVYRVRGGMELVSTMLSGDDDVNIARFHPDSGHSFIYGTKQGRVRVLSPRPWNFYGDC